MQMDFIHFCTFSNAVLYLIFLQETGLLPTGAHTTCAGKITTTTFNLQQPCLPATRSPSLNKHPARQMTPGTTMSQTPPSKTPPLPPPLCRQPALHEICPQQLLPCPARHWLTPLRLPCPPPPPLPAWLHSPSQARCEEPHSPSARLKPGLVCSASYQLCKAVAPALYTHITDAPDNTHSLVTMNNSTHSLTWPLFTYCTCHC